MGDREHRAKSRRSYMAISLAFYNAWSFASESDIRETIPESVCVDPEVR